MQKYDSHCVQLSDVSIVEPTWISGTVGFSLKVHRWALGGAEPARKTMPIFLYRESGWRTLAVIFQGVPISQKLFILYPILYLKLYSDHTSWIVLDYLPIRLVNSCVLILTVRKILFLLHLNSCHHRWREIFTSI